MGTKIFVEIVSKSSGEVGSVWTDVVVDIYRLSQFISSDLIFAYARRRTPAPFTLPFLSDTQPGSQASTPFPSPIYLLLLIMKFSLHHIALTPSPSPPPSPSPSPRDASRLTLRDQHHI